MGCVKRGISDTMSHTSSDEDKFSSDLGDISPWGFVSLGVAFTCEGGEDV